GLESMLLRGPPQNPFSTASVIRVIPAIPAGPVLQKFLAAHCAAQSASASLRKRPKCCVAAKRRYVPEGDICIAANPRCYSITSSVEKSSLSCGLDFAE